MGDTLLFLSMVALFGLFAGLVKPSWISRLTRKDFSSRLRVIRWFGSSFLVLMMSGGAVLNAQDTPVSNTNTEHADTTVEVNTASVAPVVVNTSSNVNTVTNTVNVENTNVTVPKNTNTAVSVPAPTPEPEPYTPPEEQQDASSSTAPSNCHPSYSGCLRADASDYDCLGGSGNGPYYTGRVEVIGPDVFGLDRDHDGIGCE